MLFDLVVIGSGPSGTAAALEGARAGKKVALVEEKPRLGGDCVHQSTLPSKALRESVIEQGAAAGKKTRALSRLLHRRDRVVDEEAQAIQDELKQTGVALYQGRARLRTANDVEVESRKGKERITASAIILAVGARPVAPQHLRVDGQTIFDSNSILSLKSIPKSLVVLGGGIVGCEYASIFAEAGSQVILVDRRHEILAAVDREIVGRLSEALTSQGVEILLEADTKELVGGKVSLSTGRELAAEAVLVAQGRFGNTTELGLDEVGVERDGRGLIPVDTNFRTNVPNIYAVGDVVGPPAYASTGMEEGKIACRHALRLPSAPLPVVFPYVIFTIPEISMVGSTEEDLQAAKADYVVGRAEFAQLARGRLRGAERGLLKLLVERHSRKLLGVHIFGEGASELIHVGQAVMSLGGDAHYLAHAVFNYPTLSEAYKAAALQALSLL